MVTVVQPEVLLAWTRDTEATDALETDATDALETEATDALETEATEALETEATEALEAAAAELTLAADALETDARDAEFTALLVAGRMLLEFNTEELVIKGGLDVRAAELLMALEDAGAADTGATTAELDKACTEEEGDVELVVDPPRHADTAATY